MGVVARWSWKLERKVELWVVKVRKRKTSVA